ncbi:hypothetical protein FEM21_09770 [Flavobacterium seoulense]|uniref:Uncharacterized protein n=1 Tax=Flavobacterium seoulense TaxID=1492738 RepID=A0A066WPK2_9FLAO|nr:hypothetical protein FEM21_09770 [Flavobacterium seoulense]
MKEITFCQIHYIGMIVLNKTPKTHYKTATFCIQNLISIIK